MYVSSEEGGFWMERGCERDGTRGERRIYSPGHYCARKRESIDESLSVEEAVIIDLVE